VVEAVAGLAQGRPRRAWVSLVLNRHRLVRIPAATNRRDLHFANIAYGGANRFPDLPEGVQILEFNCLLFRLSRSHYFYYLPADPTRRPFGKWFRELQGIFHGTLPSGVLAGPVN
jgi:hypothetical protein